MQVIDKAKFKSLAVALLLAGFAVPAVGAEAGGTWAVSLNTDGGAGMMNLVLEQEGEVLTGTVSGDVGNAPVTGKIENQTVTFSHNLPDYGIAASYSGVIEGNTIKGTVDFGGGAATGSFTAERKE